MPRPRPRICVFNCIVWSLVALICLMWGSFVISGTVRVYHHFTDPPEFLGP